MRVKKTLYFLSIVLLSVFLASCVEFKKQSMTYCYNSEKDELRIFQAYEGIYAEGQDGKITDIAKQQLGDVIMGQRTFFFANWILEYDRKEIQKHIAQSKDKTPSEEFEKAFLEIAKLLVDSVKVTNGQFYLNKDKELCAYQEVTVSNVSKLIVKVNQLGILGLKPENIKKIGKDNLNQARIVLELCKSLRLDGNQLKVTCSQSMEEYLKMRETVSKKKELSSLFLKKNLQINRDDSITTFVLGNKDAAQTQIEVSNLFENHEYNPLVLDYVRGHLDVKENLDVDKIRDKFLGTNSKKEEN